MPDLWSIVIGGAVVLAAAEVVLVERYRRHLMARDRHAAASSAAPGSPPGSPARRGAWRAARAVLTRRAAVLAERSAAPVAADTDAEAAANPFAQHAVHYVLQTMRSKSASGTRRAPPQAPPSTDSTTAPAPDANGGAADGFRNADAVTAVAASPPPAGEPDDPLLTPDNGEWASDGGFTASLDKQHLADAPPVASGSMGEAIVYVDAAGHLTFANRVARELLHWDAGRMALGDLLAGGHDESSTLLEAVANQELVRLPMTLLAGAVPVPAEINALALRDRNGNLWGAALFIRRAAAA